MNRRSKQQEINEKSEPAVNIDAKLEEAEQRMREDQREIETRKKNCIIHNLQETEDEDKDEKRAHDIAAVDSFMNECEVHGNRPVFYMRLGKKTDDVTKTRPLKVIFESEEEKLTLVKKYCRIRREGSEEQKESIKGISIVPDRTIKEREEYQGLLKELDAKKAKGEKNWVIRNWKLRQK